MRTLYILFLLAFYFSGVTQNLRIAENKGIEVPGTIVAIGNKIYYSTKHLRINGCCNDSVFVIGRTFSGQEFLRKCIYVAPHLNYFNLVKTDDNNLLVWIGSEFTSCDESSSNTQLIKLDTLGNINFTFNDFRKINGVVPTSGGGFFSFSNNYLQEYNALGQLTNTVTTTMGTLTSAFEYSPSVYIGAFATTTGPKLKVFDAQFLPVSEVSTGALLRNIQASADGGIVGYSGSTLYKYSQSLNQLHQYTVGNATLSAICTKNDSVYAAAYAANGVPVYVRLDSSFALTHTTQSNLEKSIITSLIKPNDNQLYALISTNKKSNGLSLAGGGVNYYNHMALYRTAVNGDLNSTLDIGLGSVTLLSQLPYVLYGWPKRLKAIAQVVVKNYSTDTVKSFNVNTLLGSGGITYCLFGLNQNFKKTIPPGDSVSVVTDTFVSFISSSSPPNTYTLCIFTSLPGGQIDMNAENDERCIPATNVYFSISTFDHEKPYSVFPSPVKNTLHVYSTGPINSIEVRSSTGELVYTSANQVEEEQQINFSTYPAGLYVICISAGEKNHYQKIIKEN